VLIITQKYHKNILPEEVMRLVTTEIIEQAIKLGHRNNRVIYISKTSGGKGTDVNTLNLKTSEGKENLEKFLKRTRRHYTFSGLGSPEESNAINWRVLNLPYWRRLLFQVAISFFKKGIPSKNNFYRWMGIHVDKGSEIM